MTAGKIPVGSTMLIEINKSIHRLIRLNGNREHGYCRHFKETRVLDSADKDVLVNLRLFEVKLRDLSACCRYLVLGSESTCTSAVIKWLLRF